jgi:hypothetical protein
MVASEVSSHIFAAYETGDLLRLCGWCNRLDVDGDWVLAPRIALAAIEAAYAVSHSICPECLTRITTERPVPLALLGDLDLGAVDDGLRGVG